MAVEPGLTTWVATRWARLTEPGRVAGVDLARGLAVVGMFAAHMVSLPDLDVTDAATWGAVVGGRSSILFATLAGVSIGLVTGGRRPLTGPVLGLARRRLAIRAGLVWLMGLALMMLAVPVYVILPAYGVLFLIVLPLLRLPAGWLFALAGTLALITPIVWAMVQLWSGWETDLGLLLEAVLGLHYPFPVWSAFIVAGLGVARLGLASTIRSSLVFVTGAVVAMIGYTIGALWAETPVLSAVPHSSGIGEVLGSGGFALATIGLCVLLCATPLTWLALPLRAVGSMPLTAYAAQLIAWAIVQPLPGAGQSKLDVFRDLQPFLPFTLWTILGCTIWAVFIGRGPLEWAIDRVARAMTGHPLTRPIH